jgi:endonuclease/exonuclease/phosphatase (EEP) superfamily protein YafD
LAINRHLRRACWLYLVAIVALWVLLFAADRWWPATLLMFGPRWVLALPAVVLVPAVAWRRRLLAVVLIALAVVLGPIMGLCLPWRAARTAGSGDWHVRVLTWNVHYRRPTAEAVQRLIDEAQPDLAAFQEWHTPRGKVFTDGDWHCRRDDGIFLASRFPITATAVLGEDSMGEAGSVVRYGLSTPHGRLELFALHLATPRHGLEQLMDERPQGFAGIRANSALRWRQMDQLRAAADLTSGPVLLAGDFNTPSESAIFRRYWSDYTDAFGAAGCGWGYTFITRSSQVRIDHILAGPGWRCSRCWVGPNLGSPHRPVIADFTWVGSGE